MTKKLLLLILLASFYSCKQDKKTNQEQAVPEKKESKKSNFATSNKMLTTKDFKACAERKCPEIRVSYVQIDSSFKNYSKLNKSLENEIATIIGSNTQTDLSGKSPQEAAEFFIQDYFEFEKEYEESFLNYELEVEQSLLAKTDNTLSFQTKFYIFTGGAHGYGATNYSNFNKKSGQLLTNKDLFTDKEAFAKYAEKKFRKKYAIPENEAINVTGFLFEENKFALPENIALTEEEVLLLYHPYEAASYSEGVLEMRFDKEEVKQWLAY